MASFDIIADHYDNIMTNREIDDFYLSLLKIQDGNNKKVLDLGCGTGMFLSKLNVKYKMGIDASSAMITEAKKRNPSAFFQVSRLEEYELTNLYFDYITCMYDVINIITDFNEWKKIFSKISISLTKNGKFIFDVNTLERQKYLCSMSPFVKVFNDNYSLTFVSQLDSNLFEWKNILFLKKDDTSYILKEMFNIEYAPEVNTIELALKECFNIVETYTNETLQGKSVKGKVFFVCSN